MTTISLKAAAWFGDRPLVLDFPDGWDVTVIGPPPLSELTGEQIAERFRRPIGTPPLSELAKGKQRVAIVVDDLTRPTPIAPLLPSLFGELERAGVSYRAITIVVAGGTHAPATPEEVRLKLGAAIPQGVKVVTHDSDRDCVTIGRSRRGIPLSVNGVVVDADLKIGIGGIYPHPAAGFSGGSKIIAPAACGTDTIRSLHDYLRGARDRGDSTTTEFREEIEEVASRIGLDCIVNVVLNQSREIAAVFVGDRREAHRAGVEWATRAYAVQPVQETDVVIADIYPYDLNLQFAHDRGFWPLENAPHRVSKVVLAACSAGVGGHRLYPVTHGLRTRLFRRLMHLCWKDFRDLSYKMENMIRLWHERRFDFMMLAPGLTQAQLSSVFPRSIRYATWVEVLTELQRRHPNPPVHVALYQCAPFLFPRQR